MKIRLILFITLMVSLLNAQVSKTGTSAATFLKIPVGARAVAMGGSFVSVVDDASSLYWNPGGLAKIDKMGLIFNHMPWLGGINFNFLGIGIPLDQFGNIGLSVTSMTTEEMEVTTVDNQMGTGETFDAGSVAIGLTYARSLTDRFTIGATFKIIYERIYNSVANGIALDIGTTYDTPLKGLRLGFSITNFGTKMHMTGEDLNYRLDIAPNQNGNKTIVSQIKTEEFDLPLIMRVGLSMDVWQDDFNRVIISVDGVNPSDNLQSVNTGLEWSLFKNAVFLRGGLNEMFLENRERGFAVGGGINYSIDSSLDFQIGYAFQEFLHLPNVNSFTLNVLF
ncbi:MAG: PorV/PorQ family protein [Calditrichae bacterium]|nr:PorV/PorQ family protein [Calditrichota bacterium]MCB9057782.1 PorV/PorQ family protein [Calditrichia bacterium]